jgi:hypothetical protein
MGEKSAQIEQKLEELVDSFVTEGSDNAAVLQTIADHLIVLRLALDRDPEAAKDDADLGEPANDWPGSS